MAVRRKDKHQHHRGKDPAAEVRALLKPKEAASAQVERLMLVLRPVMRSNKSRPTLPVLKHAAIVVKYFLLRYNISILSELRNKINESKQSRLSVQS